MARARMAGFVFMGSSCCFRIGQCLYPRTPLFRGVWLASPPCIVDAATDACGGFKKFGNRQRMLVITAVLSASAALSVSLPASAQSLEEGIALRAEGRHDRSFRVFHHLAEQGIAEAQLELGTHYWRGWGVERDDAEAFRWFSLAA